MHVAGFQMREFRSAVAEPSVQRPGTGDVCWALAVCRLDLAHNFTSDHALCLFTCPSIFSLWRVDVELSLRRQVSFLTKQPTLEGKS